MTDWLAQRSALIWTGWIVLVAVVAFSLGAALADDDDDVAPAPKPTTVTYIECGPGQVHVWLFPDGGGAVMPAGADCPDAGPNTGPRGERE